MAFQDHTIGTRTARPFIPSPMDVLHQLSAWNIRRTKRRAIRDLLTCDADRLADLGITRGDIHDALMCEGDVSLNLQRLARCRRVGRGW